MHTRPRTERLNGVCRPNVSVMTTQLEINKRWPSVDGRWKNLQRDPSEWATCPDFWFSEAALVAKKITRCLSYSIQKIRFVQHTRRPANQRATKLSDLWQRGLERLVDYAQRLDAANLHHDRNEWRHWTRTWVILFVEKPQLTSSKAIGTNIPTRSTGTNLPPVLRKDHESISSTLSPRWEVKWSQTFSSLLLCIF